MSFEMRDNRTDSGFLMGMLTGITVGVGLGMLFAPQAGSDLRHQIADSASTLKQKAGEHYDQTAARVQDAMGRGKEVVQDAVARGRQAVDRGADKIERAIDSAPFDGPSFTS